MASERRAENPKATKTFDLEERTARFGEAVVQFCKSVRFDPITTSLVSQLIRSATSVGANYLEANDSESKKDFRHKIALCRKESKETKHWLRMIVSADSKHRNEAAILWKEATELNLIFGAILRRKP
jgi:four helix bundle protein